MPNQWTKRRAALANNPMAAAVPDSKNFGDPEAPEFPPALVGRHVGGIPCEELPPDIVCRLSIQHTDEAIAERNAGKAEPGSTARETRGPREHAIQHFRDDRVEAPLDQGNFDPFQDIERRHGQPGQQLKFFNPNLVAKLGWEGYTQVLDTTGKPVTLGEMLVGSIPKHVAEARRAKALSKSQGKVAEIYNNLKAEQESIARELNTRPLAGVADSSGGFGLQVDHPSYREDD